jgi:cyclopropane-fatty-acyl-phospholipid synthase
MAATRYGCKVHGVTLSPSQLAYARQRAERGGWADRAQFELRDYRDLSGQYDHVVSIEMLEAVGERYWERYFRQVRDCLRPGGRAVIQVITIADARFAAYRRGTDFIQRHIFPGGMLLSPSEFERRSTSADFRIVDRHAFGLDYARTLQLWHEQFNAAWPEIGGRDGFDERFNRLWRFYLAYCEAGFRAGATDVYQFLIERPA